VIYETHVRGCTIHPSSGVAYPGAYRMAGAHFKEWLKNEIIENTNHAQE
jgi:pullulanase/glycogen debranching enzyme